VRKLLLTSVFFVTFLRSTYGIRPFVTDDARVVGGGLGQLETWVRSDSNSFQHWVLPAYGPTNWLEISAGFLHGPVDTEPDFQRKYSLSGPLIQGKFLLHSTMDSVIPGIAIVTGGNFNGGFGALRPRESSPYGYAAFTWNLGKELLLVHANVGAVKAVGSAKYTWGIGGQLRMYKEWNLIAEVFSGDPYAERDSGGAVQGGFRYILSDFVQFDGSYGIGAWGDPRLPYWLTFGFRGVLEIVKPTKG
jgi:hypothetical protein